MHFVSTAFCTEDEAAKLKEIRGEMKTFTESASFRRRVYDHLMWSLKGLTLEWRKNDENGQFATPQVHDEVVYIPYSTPRKENKLETVKWAVFTPVC